MIQQNYPLNGVGYRIRELRKKKGLNQTQLARLIGCAPNTVTEWEKRTGRAPGKKLLGKVAEILEISVDYLLGIQKVEQPQIPCYDEILTDVFFWPSSSKYYIEIPPSEYNPGRFSFRILDNLLEPVICKGDYGIFEKLPPEDGDIVVVRFPEKDNKAMIKRWRQRNNTVMLSEINLYKVQPPYFFEIISLHAETLVYTIEKIPAKHLVLEGRLVTVKRAIKFIKSFPRVNYIFF